VSHQDAAEGTDSAFTRPGEGAEGNARLTGALGTLLTVLLVAEGLTILAIRELITIHVFLGLLLLTPAALKIGTTTYRFVRYYLHDRAYVRRGPPQLLLRVIAPVLVLATVAMLASGVALLTRSPGNAGILLTVHKASFIVWAALMVVHFLGHVVEGLRLTVHDWRPARGVTGHRGRATRRCVVLFTLLVGVGVAATFTPTNHWSGQQAPGEQQHQHER